MRPDLLHILQHSLGVDQYGRGNQYRNGFVTGPGSTVFPKCRELCDLGLMVDHGARVLFGGSHCFSVTPEGIAAVAEHSPKPPKVSRSARRYHQWLKADCGIPFGEWLKMVKQA